MHLFTFENYLFRRHFAIESCNRSFVSLKQLKDLVIEKTKGYQILTLFAKLLLSTATVIHGDALYEGCSKYCRVNAFSYTIISFILQKNSLSSIYC